RTQVIRSFVEHLIGEEARAIAVMDDRTFDISHKGPRFGVRDISGCQTTYLAHGRIILGNHCVESRIGVIRVRVPELESTKLRMSNSCPASWVSTQGRDISPADGFVRPTQGLGFRLPHGDYHRARHQ